MLLASSDGRSVRASEALFNFAGVFSSLRVGSSGVSHVFAGVLVRPPWPRGREGEGDVGWTAGFVEGAGTAGSPVFGGFVPEG